MHERHHASTAAGNSCWRPLTAAGGLAHRHRLPRGARRRRAIRDREPPAVRSEVNAWVVIEPDDTDH